MAYMRTKQHRDGGNWYYYLVESYRNHEGKPRQRVLKYFGKMTFSDPCARYMHLNQARQDFERMRDIEAAFFGDSDFADDEDWTR